LGITGILFLTLYPFRFAFAMSATQSASPFLLGSSDKPYGLFNAFLNILLFIPFGFGLAARIKKYARGAVATAFLALIAGGLLSYSIEFLQLFIPGRDSGWDDVVTNSIGAFAGALAFQVCGAALLHFLRDFENTVEAYATKRNLTIALLLYFGFWFGASARLQRQARLSGWKSDAVLVVGGSPRGQLAGAWRGEIYSLEFWDHALPSKVALQLTASGQNTASTRPALVAYQFVGSPPFLDQNHLLPGLEWVSPRMPAADPPGAPRNGTGWVATAAPVDALIADIEKTGQFSIRVRCKPFHTVGVSAGIISIGQPGGPSNVEIWQENESVGFWFRTPLTVRRALLAWQIPKVFVPDESRDLLFSYNGSNASLTIDGRRIDPSYHLGPGAALAHFVRRMKTVELQGYRYIFYALVFFPAGSLLAIGWREHPGRIAPRLALAIAGFVLPPVLLELLLTRVAGQPISAGNIALAFAALCAGAFWINVGGAETDPSTSAIRASAS
jgi:VanZ family protein